MDATVSTRRLRLWCYESEKNLRPGDIGSPIYTLETSPSSGINLFLAHEFINLITVQELSISLPVRYSEIYVAPLDERTEGQEKLGTREDYQAT